MSEERWTFEKIGLGYRVYSENVDTELLVTRLKRRSETLTADLRVTTNLADVKTNNGVLHVSRFNLMAAPTRSSLAKLLASRTPGHDMDWYDGLEILCQNVLIAESKSEDITEVGQDERTPWEQNWLVEPFVLRDRTCMIFGPGGVGKSLIALTTGVSVATGEEIIPGVHPMVEGRVLYLDWETSATTINDRVQAIAAGHGISPPKLLYRRCVKPLAEDLEELAAIISSKDVKLVIVDSVAYAVGALGEHGDANEGVLRMHEAIRLMGATAFLIDHVNKVDARTKPGEASPYGSVYKTNAVRMSWEVRKAPSPEGELRINVYHAKSNDTHQLDPLGIALDWTHDIIRFRSVDVLESEEKPARPYIAQTVSTPRGKDWGPQIIQIVTEWGTWIRVADVQKMLKAPNGDAAPEDTAKKYCKRFVERGVFERGQGVYEGHVRLATGPKPQNGRLEL